MPSIVFRFKTECQMTIEGDSYEEAYLKFKDFMHGEQVDPAVAGLEIFPPEDPTIFFEVDDQTDYSTIEKFKGDFVKDVVENCPAAVQKKIDHHAVH